jgi:hypothetical protein
MNIPDHLHHRVVELLNWQLEAAKAERAYWEKKLEYAQEEHFFRCHKARCNEEGTQII